VFRNAEENIDASIVRVGLYKNISNQWTGVDGTILGFYATANNEVDTNDILKLNNGSENIAFVNGNFNFSSEHKQAPLGTEVYPLKVWNTSQSNYKLRINTQNYINSSNLYAYLIDNYLGTSQQIPLDNSIFEYPFNVTTDINSTGNRFQIQFSTTALSENSENLIHFVIYPNPTKDVLTIDGVKEKANYKIYTSIGQIITQGIIENQVSNIMVDSLASGIYFIELFTEKGTKTIKFIKQ
jgi:Secretion system C-terminal sorting domain